MRCSANASVQAVRTERAVIFLIRVLGTVPVPVHDGLLNKRLITV